MEGGRTDKAQEGKGKTVLGEGEVNWISIPSPIGEAMERGRRITDTVEEGKGEMKVVRGEGVKTR